MLNCWPTMVIESFIFSFLPSSENADTNNSQRAGNSIKLHESNLHLQFDLNEIVIKNDPRQGENDLLQAHLKTYQIEFSVFLLELLYRNSAVRLPACIT